MLRNDRGQVGCQVYLNSQLKDVIVLSDPTYMIKFSMPNNNAAGHRNGNAPAADEARLSFKFKKLLNDDEEQLGMKLNLSWFDNCACRLL